jgi:hypothetical protein
MTFNIETYLNSLPEDIEIIDISKKSINYLPSLKRFKNLKELNCSGNNLTSLPELNENLKILYCFNNPIYKIINSYDINIIKQRLKILNNFHYLYYCLKFKKQFRDWLWLKVRRPKIFKDQYIYKALYEPSLYKPSLIEPVNFALNKPVNFAKISDDRELGISCIY